MKIALLLNMKENFVKQLKQKLSEHQIEQMNPKDSEIFQKIKDVEVIIGANVNWDILDHAINLKLFQVPWVGLDRVNFDKLREKNVPICNSKWNERIVAEYALTLLLSVMKHIVPVHNYFSRGSWELRSLQSRQLTNSKILLIGYGSIGKELAKLLQPFNSDIYALRNNPKTFSSNEFNLVKEEIGWERYDEIVKFVDIIINSLPLTPKTENILNEERIKSMNSNILFINVGRGKTVNEKALYTALKNKTISGAGLDVWYNYKRANDPEPFYPSKFPFHELENVIISPHRAATFNDTPETVWEDTIYNIKALESGKQLKNVISFENKY